MNKANETNFTEETTKNELNEKLNHLGSLLNLSPKNATILNLLENDFKTIPFGTHIAVPFFLPSKQVAWHHGIYYSDKQVIDLMNRYPNIQTRSLKDFFKVNDVSPTDYAIVNYENDSDEMLELTCLRAKYLELNPPNIAHNPLFYSNNNFKKQQ